MIRGSAWGWVVLVVNSVGFVTYLAWLALSARRVLYTQDGVLFLLPCLPFLFVFVFLFRKPAAPSPGER